MQLKKAKEIEKARLMREKNVMEARRRARSLVLPLLLGCNGKRCSELGLPTMYLMSILLNLLKDLWTEQDRPETTVLLLGWVMGAYGGFIFP